MRVASTVSVLGICFLSVVMAANLVACGCGTAGNNAEVEQEAVVEESNTEEVAKNEQADNESGDTVNN